MKIDLVTTTSSVALAPPTERLRITYEMATSQNVNDPDSTDALRTHLVAALVEARRALDHLEVDYHTAMTDESVIQEDRDAIRLLVEQSRTHHARAADAVMRLDDGTYGQCERCGEAIGSERLEAIPDATTCRACSA